MDAFSKYRCWVYQRADLNRVLMSQALGAFCDLKQDVSSYNYSEGAAVAIDMVEYERERKLLIILNFKSLFALRDENFVFIFQGINAQCFSTMAPTHGPHQKTL